MDLIDKICMTLFFVFISIAIICLCQAIKANKR